MERSTGSRPIPAEHVVMHESLVFLKAPLPPAPIKVTKKNRQRPVVSSKTGKIPLPGQ